MTLQRRRITRHLQVGCHVDVGLHHAEPGSLAVWSDDDGVLVIRAEIAHFRDRDQSDLTALRRGDPAEVFAFARFCEPLDQAIEARRGAADALLQARDRRRQPGHRSAGGSSIRAALGSGVSARRNGGGA